MGVKKIRKVRITAQLGEAGVDQACELGRVILSYIQASPDVVFVVSRVMVGQQGLIVSVVGDMGNLDMLPQIVRDERAAAVDQELHASGTLH